MTDDQVLVGTLGTVVHSLPWSLSSFLERVSKFRNGQSDEVAGAFCRLSLWINAEVLCFANYKQAYTKISPVLRQKSRREAVDPEIPRAT